MRNTPKTNPKRIALWNPNEEDIRVHVRRGLRERVLFLPAKGVINLDVDNTEDIRVSRKFKTHSLSLAESEGLIKSFT